MVHEDFSALKAILSDRETMKFYPKPYDDEGVNRWISWCQSSQEKWGFSLFAVILKETGQMIGDTGVSMQNIHGRLVPEIGYHINKRYWRQGYATETTQAVKDWLFSHFAFDDVYSYMDKDNIASAKTALSNGMTLVDSYRDAHGEDLLVYRITREEWIKEKTKTKGVSEAL